MSFGLRTANSMLFTWLNVRGRGGYFDWTLYFFEIDDKEKKMGWATSSKQWANRKKKLRITEITHTTYNNNITSVDQKNDGRKCLPIYCSLYSTEQWMYTTPIHGCLMYYMDKNEWNLVNSSCVLHHASYTISFFEWIRMHTKPFCCSNIPFEMRNHPLFAKESPSCIFSIFFQLIFFFASPLCAHQWWTKMICAVFHICESWCCTFCLCFPLFLWIIFFRRTFMRKTERLTHIMLSNTLLALALGHTHTSYNKFYYSFYSLAWS